VTRAPDGDQPGGLDVTRRLGHAARAQIVVVVVGQRHHVDARGGQGREPRRRGHEPHPRAPRAGLRRPRHHRRLEVGEREVGGDEQRRDLDERIVGLGGDRREATRHVATEHHVADEGQGDDRNAHRLTVRNEARSWFIHRRRQELQSEAVTFEDIDQRMIKAFAMGEHAPP
jgi:hypothetical protein